MVTAYVQSLFRELSDEFVELILTGWYQVFSPWFLDSLSELTFGVRFQIYGDACTVGAVFDLLPTVYQCCTGF